MRSEMKRGVRLVCISAAFMLLVLLVAYQRFLLIESRLISMCQTRYALLVEYWLRKGDSEHAIETVRKAQDLSVNYMLYRKIMYIDVADILDSYRKIQGAKLTPEASKEVDDYSNKVIEECFGEKATYYSIVDHWLLPKMFSFFVPVDQDQTDTAKCVNPAKQDSALRGER